MFDVLLLTVLLEIKARAIQNFFSSIFSNFSHKYFVDSRYFCFFCLWNKSFGPHWNISTATEGAAASNLGCWHSCGCHLTRTTHPTTVVDQVPHHHNNTTRWQRLPCRTVCPDTLQTLLRNSSRNAIKAPRCWTGLQIPQIPIWSSICRTCRGGLIQRGPTPPRYRTQRIHYKTSWNQTSQDTFRGLESMSWQVRAVGCTRGTFTMLKLKSGSLRERTFVDASVSYYT